MNQFEILANEYLSIKVTAFFHVPYTRMGSPGNPNYLNDLKNTFNDFSQAKLQSAVQELTRTLQTDLPNIFKSLGYEKMVVCVIPK